MTPDEVKKVLLIQSIEEADKDGSKIPHAVRKQSTREATKSLNTSRKAPNQHPFFFARANCILLQLNQQTRHTESLESISRLKGVVSLLVLLGAIAGGLATSLLGGAGKINLLSLPLWAIFAWNLFAYFIFAISLLPWLRISSHLAGKVIRMFGRWGKSKMDTLNFTNRYLNLSSKGEIFSLAALLHFAAALWAAFAVAAMYIQGLRMHLSVYWESTWLSPEDLHRLFSVLFYVPNALFDLTIPPAEELEKARVLPGTVNGGMPAPIWIHSFATAIGLYIVVPRLILGSWKLFQFFNYWRNLSYWNDESGNISPYFERLLGEARGKTVKYSAIPYRSRPDDEVIGKMEHFLERQEGCNVNVEWTELSDQGSGAMTGKTAKQPTERITLVFQIKATLEDTAQGAFLKQVADKFPSARSQSLTVFLDARDYKKRNPIDFEETKSERGQKWKAYIKKHFNNAQVIILT